MRCIYTPQVQISDKYTDVSYNMSVDNLKQDTRMYSLNYLCAALSWEGKFERPRIQKIGWVLRGGWPDQFMLLMNTISWLFRLLVFYTTAHLEANRSYWYHMRIAVGFIRSQLPNSHSKIPFIFKVDRTKWDYFEEDKINHSSSYVQFSLNDLSNPLLISKLSQNHVIWRMFIMSM